MYALAMLCTKDYELNNDVMYYDVYERFMHKVYELNNVTFMKDTCALRFPTTTL
jgi:hypothetical protein